MVMMMMRPVGRHFYYRLPLFLSVSASIPRSRLTARGWKKVSNSHRILLGRRTEYMPLQLNYKRGIKVLLQDACLACLATCYLQRRSEREMGVNVPLCKQYLSLLLGFPECSPQPAQGCFGGAHGRRTVPGPCKCKQMDQTAAERAPQASDHP